MDSAPVVAEDDKKGKLKEKATSVVKIGKKGKTAVVVDG